jgi:hypothetical protein
LFPAGVVVGAEVGDHAEGERAVVFAIDFDVTFEIPDELAELAGGGGVEVADEVAEDVGDDVFAAEGEGGGGGGEVAGVDDVEGRAYKGVGEKWPWATSESRERMGVVSARACCMASR